ncbi:D-glycero-beta-D-manno-heptose-7-phosphate kinase [Dissulfurirhabdus thermomarina]|uniref:D-glycero-beta-D-manno-heptose-7-phosphate kinase n=1 Tax=Dissulfurirhabdus thermomarina TaxID=1765737 RepID=A0A6N9TK60_DISTH|nr:D-glycero-beta-D-manno-heptose-7-phosphate kinase [Dissulfurirhabdus thermomarina]NDY41635.1 D-glycero-beta-D-manno-heptose-7-phosphate kinase [Dissulfurirhabdus thermomarina]NMX23322.1 D-glycero-beta-D-manno-heptose-7-phosphate kinase [Dissulfurirhabdus thermomarina]
MTPEVDLGALAEAVPRFRDLRLLVVGDLMLDQFVWGETSRISPEAPVPVVEVQQETFLLGGAANVAHNLRALGAGVLLAGVVGRDGTGRRLRELAEAEGIDVRGVVADGRGTTLKTRVLARGQQVVRVDRESRKPPDPRAAAGLEAFVSAAAGEVDAVVVSDYAKGVVTAAVMAALGAACRAAAVPLLVDPKPANADLYLGVDIVTPNRRETEALSGVSLAGPGRVEEAGRRIHRRLDTRAVLMTLGGEGMALWEPEAGLFTIPTMAREVYDVTGAGDTVVAALALALADGRSFREGAVLANAAAGVVVGKVGTATVSPAELASVLAGGVREGA